MDTKILQATLTYISRKERWEHPSGTFDKKGRWYPDEDREVCQCCDSLSRPTNSFPYSLMKHCRTLKHVSNLYGIPSRDINVLLKGFFNNLSREILHRVVDKLTKDIKDGEIKDTFDMSLLKGLLMENLVG